MRISNTDVDSPAREKSILLCGCFRLQWLVCGLMVALSFILMSCPARADFIGKKGATLQDGSDWWYQGFTVGGTTTFAFYFAAQYNAQAVVCDTSQTDAFTSGGSVRAFSLFESRFGIQYVTLEPGSYFVGVRNRINGQNLYSLELEEHPDDRWQLASPESHILDGGQSLTQTFTIPTGTTCKIEGCNTGDIDFYVIPLDEEANFRSNQSFQYYDGWEFISDPNQPGLATLSFSPGTYCLAFRNNGTDPQSLVYVLYGEGGGTGGGDDGGGTGGGGDGTGGGGDGTVRRPNLDCFGMSRFFIEPGSSNLSKSHGTHFGVRKLGRGSSGRVFTITNRGDGVLHLAGKIVVTGGRAFRVVSQPGQQMLQPGESTTFKVRFRPTRKGLVKATVVIWSNDSMDPRYTFMIAGRGRR